MQSEVLDDQFFATLPELLPWMHGPRKDVVDVESSRLLIRAATATEDDVKDSLLLVQAAQVVWQELQGYGRTQVMSRFRHSLWRFQEEIVAMSQMLSGKSKNDANEELLDLLTTTRSTKTLSQRPSKRRRGRGSLPFSKWRVNYHPAGAIGMYTSPEWPMSSLCDVLQALVAGNAVINFVTPQAAPGAVLLYAMLVDAGMPHGLWKIIPATTSGPGRSIVPGLDMVVVLGSRRLGRCVARSAQETGVPFKGFLQLLNTGVVCEDANFNRAIRGIARAGFQSAGQAVTALEVVFVQDTIYDDFQKGLKEYVEKQVVVGSLSSNDTTAGSLLNAKRAETLQEYIDDAVAMGAQLICGGKRRQDLGEGFFEPTILADVPREAKMYGKEFNGPVICLVPFSEPSEVSRHIGKSRHAYLAYLFTRSQETMRNFMDAVDSAVLVVNDAYTSLYSAWRAPIQGVKDTGSGIRHGVESITQYSRLQSATRQRGRTWIPDDLKPGNPIERFAEFSTKSSVRTSVLFSDTPLAYLFRSLRRPVGSWIHGPIQKPV